MFDQGIVLVSCDDGWQAEGFAALIRCLESHGASVAAAATERGWPSYGTAIGLTAPNQLSRLRERTESISATPVSVLECYPAALARRLVSKAPQALAFIAGVNLGPNVGPDLIHSGTFGLALVANWLGLPAISISLDDLYSVDESNPGPLRFDAAAETAVLTWRALCALEAPFIVNVNFPNSAADTRAVRFAPAPPIAASEKTETDRDLLRQGVAPVSVFAAKSLIYLEHESQVFAEILCQMDL